MRLALTYGATPLSLRGTAAWSAASRLAEISDVSLLGRLQEAWHWLGDLTGALLSGVPWLMSDGLLRCRRCHRRTSLTAGTVFQDTRKPLRLWFLAMWFVTSQKNGVSALGLQRVLGLGS